MYYIVFKYVLLHAYSALHWDVKMFNYQMKVEDGYRRETDLRNVTAPCGFLVQCWGDENDGNWRTTARVQRDAEVKTIVLSSNSSSDADRTRWSVCSCQQIASWSCRTVTCQTQTDVIGTRCKHTQRRAQSLFYCIGIVLLRADFSDSRPAGEIWQGWADQISPSSVQWRVFTAPKLWQFRILLM